MTKSPLASWAKSCGRKRLTMTTSEERIAKALESLVMIVDNILAQMVMEQQDDRIARAQAHETALESVGFAQAKLKNRPKVVEFLQSFGKADSAVMLEIISMHVHDGDVVFYGVMGGETPNRKQIEGVIKDVY